MYEMCRPINVVALFSAIDEDGIHDFNTDVLETLIKFYIMEPTVTEADIDNKVKSARLSLKDLECSI